MFAVAVAGEEGLDVVAVVGEAQKARATVTNK